MIRDYHPETFTRAGLWRGVPESTYHNDETTLSASSAKVLLGKRPPTSTGALEFGTLAHAVLLEPDKLGHYAALDAHTIAGVNPRTGKRYDAPHMTARYKEAAAEVEADGRIVVSRDHWDKAHAMADAVHNHPAAAELLDAATETELSAYATHETGALTRGRFDLVGPSFVADYKTCQDANPDTFGRTCASYGYHVSAAHYLDLAAARGLDAERFFFINCEKEPNLAGEYRVSVVELDDLSLDQGRRDFAEACRRWLTLGRIDLPAYPDATELVSLPPWAFDELEVVI